MEALSRIQVFRLGTCLTVLAALWGLWQGVPVAAAYKEAQYTVVRTLSQSIEIREYAPQLVADVTVAGERNEAANSGFRQLFAYITGANTTQQSVAMTTPVTEKPASTKGQTIAMTTPVVEAPAQKIAMTTPVTESPSDEGWTIRFFLPGNYTLQTIPKPTNTNVVISLTQPRTVAVIRFSGTVNHASLSKHEAMLREALLTQGKTPAGIAEYAFYNAPFTLPFLRRNEIMLAIQ
jgi:hypothetical protein